MKLVKKILNKLNGLHYPQEYLCFAKESFSDPLHVYFVSANKVIKDITNHHLFTGYSPLIFALPPFNEINLSQAENITISFTEAAFRPNETLSKKDVLATLHLKKMHHKFADHNTIYFYRGIEAEHRFSNSFHQFIIQLGNNLFNRKPGNVFLPGNLYKQVQVAYAVPRKISLITIKQGILFNLFPTDLHGQIDEGHYLISLRRGGKAAQQVETTKKIIISEIDSAFYKTAYSLGKNHMQELKSRDQFPFSSDLSEILGIALPQSVLCYRELELFDSSDHGIHRLFLFKIIRSRQIENKPATLSHIHNVYATWRHNKGLSGNYLLR